MRTTCAILLGLAIVATQVVHGGLYEGAFLLPASGLLLIAALFSLAGTVGGAQFGRPLPLVLGALLLGYLAWRCAHVEDAYLARIELTQALMVGLAAFLAASCISGRRAWIALLAVLLTAAAAQAVLGVVQFARNGQPSAIWWFSSDLWAIYEARFPTRAHGSFLNPNQFAWFMGWSALMALAVACWGRCSVILRIVLVYLALVFVAAEVLSSSRGGLLSLAAGMLTFLALTLAGAWTSLRRGRLAVVGGVLAAVVLLGGVVAVVYNANWVTQGRVAIVSGAAEDVRSQLLEHAFRQFQVAPLLGMGPGSFIYAARLYRTGQQEFDAVFAHNDWLQTLVEYGFVGLVLAGVLVVVAVAAGARGFFAALREQGEQDLNPRSNTAASLIGATSALVAFAVHSFLDFNMHVPANALLAGVTIGMIAGAGRRRANAPTPVPTVVLRAAIMVGVLVLGTGLAVQMTRFAAADYFHLAARNALNDGRSDEALALLDQGLTRAPGHAGLLATKGEVLYGYEAFLAGDVTAEELTAEADLEEPTEGGEVIEAGQELGESERQDLYRRSAEAYGLAIAQRPFERTLRTALAASLAEAGDAAGLRAACLEAIRLEPSHAFAYGIYADFLDAFGERPRAIRIYRTAAALPGWEYPGERLQAIAEEEAEAAAFAAEEPVPSDPEEAVDADEPEAADEEAAVPDVDAASAPSE